MSVPAISPPQLDEEPTDPAVIRFAIECEAGQTYAGRFRVVDELAQGGMGVVYEAEDLERGGRVAFKVLRKSYQLHPRAVERFLAEGKLLCGARLSSAIPRGVTYGVDEACGPYLAMEILRGHTLAELARPRWTEQQVACVGVEIARALAPLHAEGMIHRDLKPQNLFVTEGGDASIRILDWGIAKSSSTTAAAESTGDGRLTGTLRYMSPEQIRGKRATAASDVYALAIVLYELYARRFCYGEDAVAYIADQVYAMWHQHAELVPLPAVCKVTPVGWEILAAALAREPSERTPDAARFADALERWLDAASPKLDKRATRPPTIPSSEARSAIYGVQDRGPSLDHTPPPIAPLAEDVHGRLEVLDGPTAERFFDLPSRTVVLGRAGADIAIDEASVSQRHASFAIAEQMKRFLVRDEGSRNGTRVNGEPLAKGAWRPLQHKDRISIGRVELMFHSVAHVEVEAAVLAAKRGGTVAMGRTPAAPEVVAEGAPKRTLEVRPPRANEIVTEEALPLVRIAPRTGGAEKRPAQLSSRAVVYSGRSAETVPTWLIVIGVVAVGLGAFFVFRALGLG